ncbi:metapyrocatechase [Haematobacter massiliensis]|uniref:Metapyrocatechase n=1 Tax=Haematobacter massiliensis TaxID=195105 RepID=A0A086Y6Q7_9RHOB|nr:VOC family protein [Haematobacter massiliensis]KFI29957.1 metapyrocatechase [Haematobacter massiliensis]OWJ69447.1 metapyrocatechase [Haematobacter massiliensis]OWJ86896.1 metapyrocatechase [Haematobacter massiliensis]QBJ25464.1 metapyrocatechase [Haematobacter massiliensis]
MTAITGRIAATKRPGELGVHSMDTFTMRVPDLRVADDFYRAFGLDIREEGNTLGLYTFGSDHRWLSLTEGPRKQLNHLSLAVFEEDFEPLRQRIEQMGVRLMDAPRGFDSNGFWFHDPFGVLIEVKIAEKTSPDAKTPFSLSSTPGGVAAAPMRSKAPIVRPRRLAHVLLFTPDVPKAIAFYTRALGLRLSDRSGDVICFMHGIHGSDHHLLAFAKSSAPGLHHCSWDMGGINEIGKGAMQMADKGYSHGWGMGRHVLGSNYFHYVRDPWGSYSEYSADIDYIPHDCDWQAGDYPGEDSIYLWGPEMPADFVHNYESDAD